MVFTKKTGTGEFRMSVTQEESQGQKMEKITRIGTMRGDGMPWRG